MYRGGNMKNKFFYFLRLMKHQETFEQISFAFFIVITLLCTVIAVARMGIFIYMLCTGKATVIEILPELLTDILYWMPLLIFTYFFVKVLRENKEDKEE